MNTKIFVTQGAFVSSIINRASKFGEIVNSPEEANVIIFSGGADISPSIYGKNNTHSYSINPERDYYEIDVYKTAIKNEAKMLGICRGHQLLLALNGAKLVQDIEIELGTSHGSGHYVTTKLPEIIPEYVNSIHHQGILINELPEGFKLLAYEPLSQIIEATVNESLGIMTVQFHPEIMREDIFNNIMEYLLKEV